LILSTGMMTIFNGIFGKDAFVTWGFRIPFLLSLVLVAIGLYIRLKIMETPQFSKVVAQQETTTAPLLQVFRRFPKEIILAALLRMSEQMPFYVVTAFVLSYMTSGEHGHYLYVQLRAHRHAHRRRGRIRPGPTVRTLLRHDRTEEDLRVGCGHHGRVGLRLLRSPGQRRHLAGVPRAVPRTRPSRHAVRPAGVDHRRILPNEPPLHGSGARIPAFVDHRRWPCRAHRDLADPPVRDRLCSLGLYPDLCGDHSDRAQTAQRPFAGRHHRRGDIPMSMHVVATAFEPSAQVPAKIFDPVIMNGASDLTVRGSRFRRRPPAGGTEG